MKDKLIPKSKFPWILGFSALMIALCAASFSVYGISTLFAGAAVSVMIMASTLEIGKLVGTTFLYRYWQKCGIVLKTYLTTAILVLMIVTSLGIFGFLSSAYQKSSIEYVVTQEKIKTTEDQKSFYQDKIDQSKNMIKSLTANKDTLVNSLRDENVTRSPLILRQINSQITDVDGNIEKENTKIQSSIDKINEINTQVNQMKLGTAEKKDVQTFRFVAEALGTSLDNVARWFILLLISVFDPLAICLVLAYNIAVYRKVDDNVYEDLPKKDQVIDDPSTQLKDIIQPTVEPEKLAEELPKTEKQVITDSQKDNPVYHDPFFKSYFKK